MLHSLQDWKMGAFADAAAAAAVVVDRMQPSGYWEAVARVATGVVAVGTVQHLHP